MVSSVCQISDVLGQPGTIAPGGFLTLDLARLAVLSRAHLSKAGSSGKGKVRTLRRINGLAVLSPRRLFERG
eukprot:6639614-Prymnesium_polylepis.1